MLEIIIKEDEIYQPKSNQFVTIPSCTIVLEHSLISVAKWESKWHIPYLSDKPRTKNQELDYVRCMTINPVKNDYIYEVLSTENLQKIKNYIDNPMTATVFSKRETGGSKKEVITAEKIYARMFANSIPIECQKWHLNRLLTLIKVCDLSNSPTKKMTRKETAQWNAQQNALRRAKYNTKG